MENVCWKRNYEENRGKLKKNCNFTVCYAKWGIYAILKHPSNGRELTDIKNIFFLKKYFMLYVKLKRYSLFQFSSFFYLWKYLHCRNVFYDITSKEDLSRNHAYYNRISQPILFSIMISIPEKQQKKKTVGFSIYTIDVKLCIGTHRCIEKLTNPNRMGTWFSSEYSTTSNS